MANLRELKSKFKKFFHTSKTSDSAIELLEKFILPFVQANPARGLSVDEVVGDFFAIDDRIFFYLKATRDFYLPGRLFIAGARAIKAQMKVRVRKGQKLLAALDRADNNVRIELVHMGEEKNFLLEKFEFEAIEDCLEVVNGQTGSFGLGDDRIKPVERRDPAHRIIRRKRLQSPDDGV